MNINLQSQDNNSTPERTPELEATKQTEKLQKELRLSEEQLKQVHEINLKYARERQISNSRTEALERIKNKDADLKRVLKPEQYEQLKNKKYENSPYSSGKLKRTNPASTRAVPKTNQTPTYRTGGVVRETNQKKSAGTTQNESDSRDSRTNSADINQKTDPSSDTKSTGTRNTQTEQKTNSHSTSTSSSSSNSTSKNSVNIRAENNSSGANSLRNNSNQNNK